MARSARGRVDFPHARGKFAELLNRTARAKERTIVSRRGKDLAAVIPLEDLLLLEILEEQEIRREDIQAARRALAEPGENLSSGEVRKQLGLPARKTKAKGS